MRKIREKHSNEYRIYGPPGCGKTTYITKQIHKAIEKHNPNSICVSSFTKAAAQNLTGKDLPIPPENIGTLHAHCYRALGHPTIAETKIEEFNKDYPDYQLSKKKTDTDESAADQQFKTQGDKLFADYQILRAKMVPKESWPPSVRALHKKWTEFKQSADLVDFTDMIEISIKDMIYPPGGATIGFFDEAQDFTPLQLDLVREWGKYLEYFLICGDDDQCQPAGTNILTPKGYKPIEKIDPETDNVLVYSRNDSCVYGSKARLYDFKKDSRIYSGNLYKVKTIDAESKCTDNHIWFAKWNKEIKDQGLCCVYLMQKEDKFRVGWCQLFRADGNTHLNVRANHEEAEKVWILEIFKNRYKASAYESLVAIQYGLPQIPFIGIETKKSRNNKGYTQEIIDHIFGNLNKEEQFLRAISCLSNHGRNIKYPLYDRCGNDFSSFGTRILKIRACNLMSELMTVPRYYGNRNIKWQKVNIETETVKNIIVYSLETEKYHTYIADNLITHNCIYNFTGATPEAFIMPEIPEDRKRVLDQSYRVPKAVQQLAEKTIQRVSYRQAKEYKPRDEEGRIRNLDTTTKSPGELVDDIEKQVSVNNKTCMVIASCSYMLSNTIAMLKKEGIPFSNVYRPNRGDWNPLSPSKGISTKDRIIAFLNPQGPDPFQNGMHLWTPEQLASWLELIKVKGILNNGYKKKLQELPEDISMEKYTDLLLEAFDPEKLEQAVKLDSRWLFENMTAQKRKTAEFPLNVMDKKRDFKDAPRLTIGTIHSVKGGQADVVYLFPDLSINAARGYTSNSENRDSVIRQFYVGITRAKEELVLLGPTNPKLSIAI